MLGRSSFLSFLTYSRTETFAPFINCVDDDTTCSTASVQFINVMNLLDLLLHIFPYFVVNWVQICNVCWPKA